MWADPYDLAGLGAEAAISPIGPVSAPLFAATETVKVLQSQGKLASVQPTTETQVFNLADTIARGIMAIQYADARARLTVEQTKAAAEESKVQAQNYVMQQLQQGKAVMVPETWLQKYSSSPTWVRWMTPILIVGGVGLLGYAIYRYTKKRTAAANPRRCKRR